MTGAEVLRQEHQFILLVLAADRRREPLAIGNIGQVNA